MLVMRRFLTAWSLNVDTIDGILRSARRFRRASLLNPFAVAKAAFLEGSRPESTAILDRFWQLKDSTYADCINSREGVLADYYCQEYFQTRERLTKAGLVHTETKWLSAFPDLFATLKTLFVNGPVPKTMKARSAGYLCRAYLVVPNEEEIAVRYKVEKRLTEMSFR